MQAECTLSGEGRVDMEGIASFLRGLTYPLYFLDFETVQSAIPQYPGFRPYAQMPFQYSLHIVRSEGAEAEHREFLGEPGTDTRRPLAESLCRDIPPGACAVAFNKAFECARLGELAGAFPDLAEHLMGISDAMRDLLDPFRQGMYYLPAMGGSFSIKSVLPAFFPGDPELDYHALDGRVQNGGDAMEIFPRMAQMDREERAQAAKALLAYCRLDTLALVKVWARLKAAAQTCA